MGLWHDLVSLLHLHLLLPTLCFSPFLDEKLQEVPSQMFKVRKPTGDSVHKVVEDADYHCCNSRLFRLPAQPHDPMGCAQISRAHLNATLALALFHSAAGCWL